MHSDDSLRLANGSDDEDRHERIGPYRILRLLGEGGMGIVYEAEELGAVRRRVALKLIKPGFSSRGAVARMEAERQALAVMNHPAIATVYNAGATDAGQPYFAMELVNGSALMEYCDTNRLTLRQRLALFVEICHGVQHAHQKGVIHRDLKPSNVLVVEQEGAAQPKIIDFGIAKALGQQLTEHTLVTQQGQTLGTAAYMSPEQAGAAGTDVDTRADVYSLGVILYELLVGELPLDPASVGLFVFFASLATGQLNAPAPSEKLTGDPRELKLIAYQRATDPQRLRREISGDLDRIALKAIEPDRTARYETVNALALDVQRYLANEPILARAPTAGYRFRKFIRRHRTAAVAGGLTLGALLLGSVATTVGMVRAGRAERLAAREASANQQVTDFLVGLFKESDPYQATGSDVTARQILERGVQRVREELSSQPLVRSRFLHTMGTSFANLADYSRARELLQESLSIREQRLGRHHPQVAETLIELGSVERTTGHLDAANGYFSRAIAIAEQLNPANDALFAAALNGLAGVRVRQGSYAQAESLYIRSRAMDSRALDGLFALYFYQGRYREAEPLMRQLLATQEQTLGPNHPTVAGTLNNLGGVYYELGRYADALPLYERARGILERTVGPTDPDLALNLSNIGEVYWKLNRHAQAERYFRRALATSRGVVAERSPTMATTLNGLAGVLRDQGRYAEAEPLYREALSVRASANHPRLAETLRDYAQLLRVTGRVREADQMLERARRAE